MGYEKAVATDRRLQKEADAVGERLGEIRWWWTHPDSGNPERVTYAQYGRDVGRSRQTISVHARAYQILKSSIYIDDFSEAIVAALSPEYYEAAAAVAEHRGVKPTTARNRNYTEVKEAHRLAEDRAEIRGTTYEEELPDAAATVVERSRERAKPARPKAKPQIHWGERAKAVVSEMRMATRRLREAIDNDSTALAYCQSDLDELIENLTVIAGRADWDKALAELEGAA